MKIIDKKNKISLEELKKMARETFGEMVKAVVDVKKEIIAVGGELHVDEETLLLERGSKQENLWGINLYPESAVEEWIEFDSMINLRPHQNNLTRGVEDQKIREVIIKIANELVER